MKHDPVIGGEKICKKCNKPKPNIAFAVDKKSKDGLRTECRQCDSERTIERYKNKIKPNKKSVHHYDDFT